MIIVISIIKALALFLFCIISGYVLVLGKDKSGIKLDYVFTAIFIILLLYRL